MVNTNNLTIYNNLAGRLVEYAQQSIVDINTLTFIQS